MEKKNLKKAAYYLMPAEKVLLEKYCREHNITQSQMVRNLVLEKLELPFVEPVRIDIDLVNYLNELTKNGNNLNQIARKINSQEFLEIIDEEILCDQVELIIKQINELRKKL